MFEWLELTPGDRFEIVRFIWAIVVVIVTAVALLDFVFAWNLVATLQKAQIPFTALITLLILDFRDIGILQVLIGGGAICSLVIFFYLARLRRRHLRNKSIDPFGWELSVCYWAFRVRGALGIAAVLFGLHYFGIAFCEIQPGCTDGILPFLRDELLGLLV